ncbi:MAG TPA: hypothetical protein VND66_10175 [Acidobacteriaceae bacterium]|nr:hypothetical protein [Acidobacteriaceae bacterium]
MLGAYCAFHFGEKALWMPAGLVVVAAVMVQQPPAQTN